MKAVIALLLGVVYGMDVDQNPYSALDESQAWRQEITYDWDNLDHYASFQTWKKEFGKTYSDITEEGHAFIKFLENWKMINDFNIAGEESYTLGMNQFSDLTGDEFKLYIHGSTGSCLQKRTVRDRTEMIEEDLSAIGAPDAIDWTDKDGKSYVTPVKDQKSCGSCWAFSTTGAIESRTAIKAGTTGSAIVELSEQQLVDCSGSYGNMGCNGGLMDNAFKYVQASGGLCSESEYEYTAKGGRCQSSTCGTKYDPITGYTDVRADSETSLQTAVAAGPVSIAIEADQSSFQFYKGGVLTGNCGTRLDHGVLVVGYGTDSASGADFWKVKNSWGTSWGEEGYIRICRNCNKNGNRGECGILMEPSYPQA